MILMQVLAVLTIDQSVAEHLQPFLGFEHHVQANSKQHHGPNGEGVTVVPVQFWHVLEVHSVDSANERGCEQNGGPGGDPFHVLVLALAHERGIYGQNLG